MKKLLITLLFSSTIFAWQVKDRNGIFVINKGVVNLEIESSGGIPVFKKSLKLNKRYSILIYYSGTAGTSNPISINRAIVYDTKQKKSLGDYAHSYSSLSGKDLEQPKWKFNKEKSTLRIIDSESGTDEKINLEN